MHDFPWSLLDYYQEQIMFGECALVLWLAFETRKRVHALPAIAVAYFGLFSIYCQYRPAPFLSPATDMASAFQTVTARSTCFLLIAILPFIFADEGQMGTWLKGFRLFAIIDSLVMIVLRLKTGAATGVIGMDSIDGTFLCLMLPLFVSCRKKIAFFPLSIAIFLSHSSTVFGLLALYAVCYLAKKFRIIFAFAALAFLIPVGQLYLGKDLTDSNGRSSIHIQSFHVFTSPPLPLHHYLLGLGTGSFQILMHETQRGLTSWFAFLHDEWGQILFEQGVVGLILVLGIFFFALRKQWQEKAWPLFLTISGLGFASFLQPTIRYFIFAVFTTFVTRIGFMNFKELSTK